MVGGSGAIVVHRALEAELGGYRVEELSPYWGLAPPALALRRKRATAITHSLPELGPWAARPDSDLIATFHNYYLDAELFDRASRAQRLFYQYIMAPAVRAAVKRAKWVTAVSRYTADMVRRHHSLGERLVVIRNGVDTALFGPGGQIGNHPVRILFAGNPIRRKGAEHLGGLAEALPDDVVMQVTIGMRGSTTGQLSTRLRENGGRKKPTNIEAIPRRRHDEMPDVYRDADILFFPTRREGLSLVVLEAMACGLPVVATDCSSMPELIDHNKGGFLFEMNNRYEMLSYLTRLIRDPVLRAEMGAYNREKILAEFSLQQMLDGYREVFASVS